jgi:hypothetical protein
VYSLCVSFYIQSTLDHRRKVSRALLLSFTRLSTCGIIFLCCMMLKIMSFFFLPLCDQNLNHRNIVKYQGSFKTKTHLYIILE